MKTKVHTRYLLKDGTRVAGVTTIIGILDKPALISWAWKLGLAGEDYKKVRDKAASIGTIAHYLAECELKNEKPDLQDYAPADVDKAENAFLGFLDFIKSHHLEPIKVEIPLVSEQFGFGGTIDIYAKTDSGLSLIDLKTSSGVYPEMKVQVAAYKWLLIENGYKVDNVHLLRIDKETGEFNHYNLNGLDLEWKFFKALLPVYQMKKQIWKR